MTLDPEVWAGTLAWADADPRLPFITDLYFAHACLAGDSEALVLFDARFLEPVVGQLKRRAGMNSLDETRDAIRDAVLPPPVGRLGRLRSYQGRGPLVAWLKIVGFRIALRARSLPMIDVDQDATLIADLASPELDALKQRYRGVFKEALSASFFALSEREQVLLQLHYGQHVSMDALAKMYSVNRSSIWRTIDAAQQKLSANIHRYVKSDIGASDSEVQSLITLLLSQLESSLARLLSDPDS